MGYSGLLSNEEVFCDFWRRKIPVIVCHVVSEGKGGLKGLKERGGGAIEPHYHGLNRVLQEHGVGSKVQG